MKHSSFKINSDVYNPKRAAKIIIKKQGSAPICRPNSDSRADRTEMYDNVRIKLHLHFHSTLLVVKVPQPRLLNIATVKINP